ncbi:MAG: DUF4395 domain-containing protein [Chitinophagaceae bacterium]
MNNALSCPVSLVTVHDKVPRIVAFFVVVLSTWSIWSHSWIVVAVMVLDFFLRSFGWSNWSPLGRLSSLIVRSFHLKGKNVDVAPKRFAAKMGLALTSLVLLLDVLGYFRAASYFAGLLIFFALLESVLDYCVGCKIYQLLLRVGWIGS